MTKTDKLIFWIVLAVSVLLLLFSHMIFSGSGEKTVTIETEGRHYASYQLENLWEPKVLQVETSYGTMEMMLSREGASITSSSCSDGLCLGEITDAGEMLVCLPNRVVVRMKSETEVDGVAY